MGAWREEVMVGEELGFTIRTLRDDIVGVYGRA